MIWRCILSTLLIVLPASTSSLADCEKGCKTAVIVQDCDGAPVEHARVELKICCDGGSDTVATTDQNGEAVFNYCTKDICGSRIVLQGFAVSFFDPNSCKKDGKTTRCTIKMCRR